MSDKAKGLRAPAARSPDECTLAFHEGCDLLTCAVRGTILGLEHGVATLKGLAEQEKARATKMEAAIRWACGEQPLADGRWFDEQEFGHERSVPRYWWRSILRLYSGIDEGNAAEGRPQSSSPPSPIPRIE